ncbi:hypothetical protein VTL71DRAFT_3832 [Oculimacula yallundae]|uniref:Uncharacterized protein n=1 Tax=Oculimacula yallundae TaxID=86028 RepID=A0ABR4C460_9HELO
MPSTKPASLVIETTLPKITQKATTTPITPPSETEIYSVAQVAYSKLVSEAALKDQNLRRLVGHANLYDKLLDEYNNCSDSDSLSDSESDLDAEIEEFATQSFATPIQIHQVKPNSESRETVIHEDTTYMYQDQQPAGIAMNLGDVLIEESGDIGLCKVPSHSDLHFPDFVGRVAEVEVKELEVFDE